jgi:glycosyltransferase involved in cell wall biosynthesis
MISVVIPCYNAATTIGETIDSVLAQRVELEILVVNDGSTDASVEVLRRYGDAVRLVSTSNQGVSAARTLGTQIARGSFIQYVDSDDLLAPGTLRKRLDALSSAGADVAHTDWQKLEQAADGSFSLGAIVRPNLDAIADDAECAAASSHFWAPPAALLYSRDMIDRIGPWSPRLPVIQDARFLFDAAAKGARFIHVPGIGAHYRVTGSSLSRRNVKRFIADCAINTAEIEALWVTQGAQPDRRRNALAEMWSHVAVNALINGLDEFEVARSGYNRATERRTLFEVAYVMRAALGPVHAATVINSLRKVRAFASRRLKLRKVKTKELR